MDSMKIDYDTRSKLMTLLPVFFMHPKLSRLLKNTIADELYEKVIDELMVLVDKSRRSEFDSVMNKSNPKTRLQGCLRAMQESDLMKIATNRPHQKTKHMIDMISALRISLNQKKSVLLAKSNPIKERLFQLMLPEHYKAMTGNDEEVDLKWLYYLFGAIDMIDPTESYYDVAQEMRGDIIERMKKWYLSYRKVGEAGDRYIVEEGSVP